MGAALSATAGRCSTCNVEAEMLLYSVKAGDSSRALALLNRSPSVLTCRKGLLSIANTVWHQAAKGGNIVVVDALLSFAISDASPFANLPPDQRKRKLQTLLDTENVRAHTPLILACVNGHRDAAARLVIAGADPFKTDRTGATALQLAGGFALVRSGGALLWVKVAASVLEAAGRARYGHADCIRAIMDNLRPDQIRQGHYKLQDKPTLTGVTPLHVAVALNRPDCVQALLEYNAYLIPRLKYRSSTDLGMPLNGGSTPLHLAADRGFLPLVRAILKHQVCRQSTDLLSVDARWVRDSEGLTPYQIASRKGHMADIIELLHPLTDLASVFSVQELAAPVRGVPRLSVLAAAALQSKLLADCKTVSFTRRSAPTLLEAHPKPVAQDTQLIRHSEIVARHVQPGVPPASAGCLRACPSTQVQGTRATSSGHVSEPANATCTQEEFCSSAPQAATVLDAFDDGGRDAWLEQKRSMQEPLGRPSRLATMLSGCSDDLDPDKMCALCFEREPELSVGGCAHKLCISCARTLCVKSITNKPLACPFCRASVGAFTCIQK